MKSKIIPILIIFVLLNPIFNIFAETGGSGVSLEITSNCGNGICEPAFFENETACPADCGCNRNGICETFRQEDVINCQADCLQIPISPIPSEINPPPVLPEPDVIPPANILNFSAQAGQGQIELSWTNPSDADYKGVRIVRSTDFYPQAPFDGVLVYNGDGESFLDTGLQNDVRYYYTAFAYDLAQNYSSGAIASEVPHKPDVIPPPEEIPTSTIPITPEIEKLNLNDFDFIQEGKKIIPIEGKININSGFPLTASIAYEKVPEVLKTMMVTLKDAGGKVFSFLLRINKEKTRYEAVISSPDPGIYPLTLDILDYKNQRLKILKGELMVKGDVFLPTSPSPESRRGYIYIVVAILALVIVVYLIRKLKNQNAK